MQRRQVCRTGKELSIPDYPLLGDGAHVVGTEIVSIIAHCSLIQELTHCQAEAFQYWVPDPEQQDRMQDIYKKINKSVKEWALDPVSRHFLSLVELEWTLLAR